jgi:RimJ/RimL family protein N-acetyltransferase
MAPLGSLLPLVAESTVVRRLQVADLQRFHAYRSDPGLAVYQGWSPMTLAAARKFIEEMADVASLRPGDWIQLAIAETASDVLIGDIGLFLEAHGSVVELGFTLCREAQGKGHATRAAIAGVTLAYAVSSAREVRAITDARNTNSMRVLERASFTRSHARHTVFKGETCTEVIYVHHRAAPDPPGSKVRPQARA